MKEIPLSQGKVALVDDVDFEMLSRWKWCAHRHSHTYYVVRVDYTKPKKTIAMHEALCGRSLIGLQVDHIDGNGLNNQRSNLRLVTIRQNAHNRHTTKKSGSHPGVYLRRDTGKWRAGICYKGKQHWLGSYLTEAEAISAYINKLNTLEASA
jgi:hypothetical protein